MRCFLSAILRVLCVYFVIVTFIVSWSLYFNFKYRNTSDNFNEPIFIRPVIETSKQLTGIPTTDNKSLITMTPAKSMDDLVCKVPQLDPYDDSISEYIVHEKALFCNDVQDNVTFIDKNGYLRINETGILFLTAVNISFSCFYRTFQRGSNDNDIRYSKIELELTKPVKLKEDFVEVRCNDTVRNYEVYRNIHANLGERNYSSKFGSPNEKQLSVVLFFIDSVSFSTLKRNLPITYNYTKHVMNMTYFDAFNKIGDNSFPNMMAIFTGKRVSDEQEGMMKEINDSWYKSTFDSWPLIWKSFAEKGYSTMHNEDNPHWGLFQYGLKGFGRKGFDFDYRPFWLALRRAASKNDTVYCHRNELKPQMMLDITRRHLMNMKDKLQFLFTFHSELSHNYNGEIERYDDRLHDFWKEMFEDGYLNKSVVIFASDHGHRFSVMRHTLVGLLEERLPFYGVWFPKWFYKLHGQIKRNLEHNSKILSSTFDVHETLVDVLSGNYEGVQRNSHSRSLSQLYPLPKNRTCGNAGIPAHYCTCIKEIELDTDEPEAEDASEFVLLKVTFFRQLDHDEKVKQGVKNYNSARALEERQQNSTAQTDDELEHVYRIGIQTDPFGATFEATVKSTAINETNTEWRLYGSSSISRTNAYADLSDCVTDPVLRKYCSCKNQSTQG